MAATKPAAITATQLFSLITSQGYRCAYTGAELTPETASLDHMTPLSRGGEHSLANLAAVRYDVNTAKGTMTYEEFVAMCREVVAHADRTQA